MSIISDKRVRCKAKTKNQYSRFQKSVGNFLEITDITYLDFFLQRFLFEYHRTFFDKLQGLQQP